MERVKSGILEGLKCEREKLRIGPPPTQVCAVFLALWTVVQQINCEIQIIFVGSFSYLVTFELDGRRAISTRFRDIPKREEMKKNI